LSGIVKTSSKNKCILATTSGFLKSKEAISHANEREALKYAKSLINNIFSAITFNLSIDLFMIIYPCFYNAFSGCTNLENITIQGNICHNISFYGCNKLTHESLMSIINALTHLSSSSKVYRYCQLGSANLAKLTDEEKAIATNKGWTLY
jgi:hypothetical protein